MTKKDVLASAIGVNKNLLEAGVNEITGGGGGSSAWGSITGTLSSQTDLQNALDAKVNTEAGKGLTENDLTDALKTSYDDHLTNTNNPHNVTLAQLGLGAVLSDIEQNIILNYILKYSLASPVTISSSSGYNFVDNTIIGATHGTNGSTRVQPFNVQNGIIKTSLTSLYSSMLISVTVSGTFSGSAGADREVVLILVRPDFDETIDFDSATNQDKIIRKSDLIKLGGTQQCLKESAVIKTFSNGLSDPFTTDGFKLVAYCPSGSFDIEEVDIQINSSYYENNFDNIQTVT